MTVVDLKVGSVPHGHAALGDLAHHSPIVVALHLLLHLIAGSGVARLPLVVLSGPTWLGGLPGVPPCRHAGAHLLIIGGPVDLPGAVSHHLRPAPGALIVGRPYHPPGRLHLKGIGTIVRHHGSRSSSPERVSHPHASDIRLLRLRADDDDQRTASTHPRDSPDPEQSPPVDGSQLSTEKVQKLFADLIAPPALSHYADPIPDSAPNTRLVPYVRTSASTATTANNSEPLDTHGLFQNYQSFHRLSGDTEKEACTAAYHDLTNLMLSQTEEPSLINVSSSRPKTDDPFPCGLTGSNEMKQKHEKLHLQWPPQSDHHKVINRTLALYQHGPPPKSGTADKWPPPPVQNPWDKSFVPKDFPTTHKIPSTMPKRWDLHASSPLMLRPPQSTAVPEVPDSEISKISSWLEAFAAMVESIISYRKSWDSSVIPPPRTISRMTFR